MSLKKNCYLDELKKCSIWLFPALLLIFAVFNLPYGYYTFLRIIITFAAIYLAYWEYQSHSRMTVWSILFFCMAIIFNPIIPVYLSKDAWKLIDIVSACLFISHMIICMKNKKMPSLMQD